jgi:hypothetical protein
MTDVRYGITVKYGGAGGTLLTFASCSQAAGAASHTSIQCATVPGVGKGHAVSIVVGSVPAPSVWLNVTGLAYKSPVVTSVYVPATSGSSVSALDTGGGQLILIDGSQFGPISFPVSTQLTVTYGKAGDVGRYTAQGCAVSSAPPLKSTITCSTDQGVGAGFSFLVSIGGQTSVVYASNAGYAPPQIFTFSGPGASQADTNGAQSVVIYGRNFGPNNAYTNALLSATYGVALKEGGAAFLARTPSVSYTAAGCAVTVPHTQVTCQTAPGAGATLGWKLVLDSQPSSTPTTNYNPPVVSAIVYASNLQPVTAANVNGGDVVQLIGQFFGPMPYRNASGALVSTSLVQRVLYGPSGTENVLLNWTAVSQTRIVAVLQPGIGVGLRFSVQVADQTSQPSADSFSYAIPQVLQLAPNRASTFSSPAAPTLVTLLTRNFAEALW